MNIIDTMALIRDTIREYYDYISSEGEQSLRYLKQYEDTMNKIESRISAMQEVVDAAVKHCDKLDCGCPLCASVQKYQESIK